MNWFTRILNRAVDQGQPAGSRIWVHRRTAAGVYVTPDEALKNATVWACVQYLSRTVAQLPWRVMRELQSGGSELNSSHPADWLIHKRPCPDMGSFSWRQSMLGTALLWGNAYAEIERDNRGAAYAMWPIHPDRVKVRRADDGRLVYDVWNAGGYAELPAADVFHLRGFGDGPVGYSVIEYAAQSIGWAQATEIFGSTFFSEGMNPSGIVETPKALTPNGADELRKDLKKLYSGPRGERTAILDAGMKFTKLATNPNDSQFIESMQHQVELICRWFGVPPHKVQHLLRSTFANIEHQSIEVVVDSITPWKKCFEEEADYKLFGPNNRQGLFTKMNLKGLLQGDHVSRAAYYKSLFEIGALTPDDICELEDMNPVGGKEGKMRFVSTNLVRLDQAGLPKAQPAAVVDPAEEPTPADQPADRHSIRLNS